MNELERIASLEERLTNLEKILDRICSNSDVCGYIGHKGEKEEESPMDKLKKYL